ncbi:MAG: hypothetical protein BMS9Abin12_1134 [Acidimicrobiia bacterium]|nr:MAG: hypothetical protein BMS9Abin12_1134 [Acidimicrobiia bacterium]
MSWSRKLLWLLVFAFVLGACASTLQADSGELSDEVSTYLASVTSVESGVDDSFDRISDALANSYNTRNLLFSAFLDVGYQGVAESALTQAEAISPPEGFVADHAAWLAFRLFASEKSVEITEAIEAQDLQMMFAVFTALGQNWGAMLVGSSRDFCLAASETSNLCQAPDDLPGGEYGAEVYEALRLNILAVQGLFDFYPDMSPEERSLRLDQVQPGIESNLKAGGDAMKAIDPPDEFKAEHQALIRYYDDQYANAVAITQANKERDDATILDIFRASGVVYDVALGEMSAEYRKIAAPWVGPDPPN